MKLTCSVCMHQCQLEEGQTGFCHARMNKSGKIRSKNYGKITAMALDPIEKKPLRRFYPGSKILSVGSYGCNLRCPFCQNYEISMIDTITKDTIERSPEQLVEIALRTIGQGNIGLAYTYNEPLIGYEYILDCAKIAKEKGLKNVVVTNGSITEEILERILPYIDAFNIDLKGFTDEFYQKIQGDLKTVKNFIKQASRKSHIEITTLIIPDENDKEEEIKSLAGWISTISPEIPLHISRFFPMWKMSQKKATEVEIIYKLASSASNLLKYVYTGNC